MTTCTSRPSRSARARPTCLADAPARQLVAEHCGLAGPRPGSARPAASRPAVPRPGEAGRPDADPHAPPCRRGSGRDGCLRRPGRPPGEPVAVRLQHALEIGGARLRRPHVQVDPLGHRRPSSSSVRPAPAHSTTHRSVGAASWMIADRSRGAGPTLDLGRRDPAAAGATRGGCGAGQVLQVGRPAAAQQQPGHPPEVVCRLHAQRREQVPCDQRGRRSVTGEHEPGLAEHVAQVVEVHRGEADTGRSSSRALLPAARVTPRA